MTFQGNSGPYPGYPGYPGDGYPGGQAPKNQSPWSSPPVLIAIIAGLLLLAGGVGAAVFYASNKSTDAAPATSSAPPSPETVTQTQQAPPTTTHTVIETAPPTQTAPQPGPAVTVAGADRQGFLGGPRCNVPEDNAVFVGYTSRSQVVICQVGNQVGRNYYKGYADGNSTEVGYPTRSGNTFVATNGATDYVVSPSALVIRQNGSVLATEPMIDSWVN
ncbi:hypothetical protein [Gordonia sp. (in: high G+C Gram-positive bacteria)]|uniref:hypothetical protein n=1 Tax=Gordonia sp. (in: high G+C Gram-positive bacteria) TaxID=84139 RepID=UPI003C718645